jgi:hypothetical protein
VGTEHRREAAEEHKEDSSWSWSKSASRGITMRYGICTKLRDRKSAKPSACRYFGKTPFSREVRIIGLSEDLNAELTESRPFLELKPFDRPLAE